MYLVFEGRKEGWVHSPRERDSFASSQGRLHSLSENIPAQVFEDEARSHLSWLLIQKHTRRTHLPYTAEYLHYVHMPMFAFSCQYTTPLNIPPLRVEDLFEVTLRKNVTLLTLPMFLSYVTFERHHVSGASV
jgi:hypothetical protein